MTFVEKFGPHLPFLRRYARALTGSQASGDAYIRAALTALAEDPGPARADLPARVALYRFFHTIWSSTGASLETGEAASAPDARLLKLTPIERQAFLLTTLESFSRKEASDILAISVEEVAELIKKALIEIEKDLATKILIIEDEPIIAADLESLVGQLGHIVTANATTRDEAVQMAKEDPPGLILCDIQLADHSSGIDAVQDILKEHDVPIIFITAFPERLLTGEKPEPTYLISKPFQENTVKAAISQALFFHPGKIKAT